MGQNPDAYPIKSCKTIIVVHTVMVARMGLETMYSAVPNIIPDFFTAISTPLGLGEWQFDEKSAAFSRPIRFGPVFSMVQVNQFPR